MPCSFCGNPQHNIRSCDSTRIVELEARMFTIYTDLRYSLLNPGSNPLDGQRVFINTLCIRFNAHELKVIAVRYTDIKTSVRKHILAFAVWVYFNGNNDIVPRLYFPDVNPDYAGDLDLPEAIILPWEMNRTPDYSLLGDYTPVNLDAQFEATEGEATIKLKKYNISPVLLCNESDEELESTVECSICYNNMKLNDSVMLNCGHEFCYACIHNTLQIQKKTTAPCALCREGMTTFIVKNEELLETVSRHCRL